MAEILKFPKNNVRLKEFTLDLYKEKDYPNIVKYEDKIIDLLNNEFDYQVFGALIESYFELDLFKECIFLYHMFKVNDNLEIRSIYYVLLSLIALQDIYQAAGIIKSNDTLNNESFKKYISDDGANYLNLSLLDSETFEDVILALLVSNYILGVAKEAIYTEINNDYLLFRFYDLINIIFEVGFDNRIVLALGDLAKKLFVLD